jgi:hypothetical protein
MSYGQVMNNPSPNLTNFFGLLDGPPIHYALIGYLVIKVVVRVKSLVALSTKRYEILFLVVSEAASKLKVMYL